MSDDPHNRIPPPEYSNTLADIHVPRGGLARCPHRGHKDRQPSCSVGTNAARGMRTPPTFYGGKQMLARRRSGRR